MKKKKNPKEFKRSHQPRKSVSRYRRTSSVALKRRKPQENKALQIITKTLRLLLLFVISSLIIYLLFKSEKKTSPSEEPVAEEQQLAEAEIMEGDELTESETINSDTLPKASQLIYTLNKVFESYNLDEAWITRKQKSIIVQLPEELPAEIIIYDIINETKKLKLKCKSLKENLKTSQSTLLIVDKKETLYTISFNNKKDLQRSSGKIAIIIDDFGYFDNGITEQFLKIKYPFTLSILPGQKFTNNIAQKAKRNNKQIMLHLPMEPTEGKVEKSEFTIMTEMTEDQVIERLNKALALLPDAVAVNNHMGSKATEDEGVMDIVFRELKRHNLMFIDSKTSLNSVAPRVAKRHNLKFEQNATFLERGKNEAEQHIRSKLRLAAKIAEQTGKVVVIGHPYQETIKVLTEELPKLEKQGLIMVPITALDEHI